MYTSFSFNIQNLKKIKKQANFFVYFKFFTKTDGQQTPSIKISSLKWSILITLSLVWSNLIWSSLIRSSLILSSLKWSRVRNDRLPSYSIINGSRIWPCLQVMLYYQLNKQKIVAEKRGQRTKVLKNLMLKNW